MSSSSKRLGEMIIVSVIVFILFVVGIVYITKNLANINTEKKSLTPTKEEIISDIKDTYKASKEPKRSDKEMREWAEAFLKYFHKDIEKDYTQK